jgi:cell division protein FtsI (penicillin-binding protein 3)
VVEPGSVHKGIVLAACLQEGIVTPKSTVLVQPSITKGDQPFIDSHEHRKPTEMTLPGILAWSSNVGTIELADRLARRSCTVPAGLRPGRSDRRRVPGEAAGLVQPPENWSATSHGSIPIGHGVSVTPLQMAAVYAAIANGGTWFNRTWSSGDRR